MNIKPQKQLAAALNGNGVKEVEQPSIKLYCSFDNDIYRRMEKYRKRRGLKTTQDVIRLFISLMLDREGIE